MEKITKQFLRENGFFVSKDKSDAYENEYRGIVLFKIGADNGLQKYIIEFTDITMFKNPITKKDELSAMMEFKKALDKMNELFHFKIHIDD